GNWLDEVALLEVEAAGAGAMAQGKVLQVALAALVADRAIERMVDEQELQRALAPLLHLRRIGEHSHALGDLGGAGGSQFGHLLDLDEAHAAGAERLHLRMVAVDGNLDAESLRGGPYHRALRHADQAPVYRQIDQIVLLSHGSLSSRHSAHASQTQW